MPPLVAATHQVVGHQHRRLPPGCKRLEAAGCRGQQGMPLAVLATAEDGGYHCGEAVHNQQPHRQLPQVPSGRRPLLLLLLLFLLRLLRLVV